MEASPDPLNRLGLALYATILEMGHCKKSFEEVVNMDHLDVMSVLLYAENLRKQEGDKAVLTCWIHISKHPFSFCFHVAYVRELQKQIGYQKAFLMRMYIFTNLYERIQQTKSLNMLYLLQLDRVTKIRVI